MTIHQESVYPSMKCTNYFVIKGQNYGSECQSIDLLPVHWQKVKLVIYMTQARVGHHSFDHDMTMMEKCVGIQLIW